MGSKKQVKAKAVDLGVAQQEYEVSAKEWALAERTLARAQEDRDKKRARAQAADTALQDAVRTIRG